MCDSTTTARRKTTTVAPSDSDSRQTLNSDNAGSFRGFNQDVCWKIIRSATRHSSLFYPSPVLPRVKRRVLNTWYDILCTTYYLLNTTSMYYIIYTIFYVLCTKYCVLLRSIYYILCTICPYFLSLRNRFSGYECWRSFPAGVDPDSPSKDDTNWLSTQSGRYGRLRCRGGFGC